MLVNKTYKFHVYPNKKQEILIVKTIGCSRFVFNSFLARSSIPIKKPHRCFFTFFQDT